MKPTSNCKLYDTTSWSNYFKAVSTAPAPAAVKKIYSPGMQHV